MSHKLALVAITFAFHLIFQIQCQDVPEVICVDGTGDNFTNLTGEYELQDVLHNGFPYYKKDECSTQYLYTYYWEPHNLHYWVFYSELTESYPETDPYLPECSADGPDKENTPTNPTQCVGGWVVYMNETGNNYTLTDITVESGECEFDVDCDNELPEHINSDAVYDAAVPVVGRSCYVRIISGRALKSADIGSESDPYVVLFGKYDSSSRFYYIGRTTTQWNNENYPIWNELFYISYCRYNNLYFQVNDNDNDIGSSDDWMGDTNWMDLDLDTLPCGIRIYKRLYLNSEGSLYVGVELIC